MEHQLEKRHWPTNIMAKWYPWGHPVYFAGAEHLPFGGRHTMTLPNASQGSICFSSRVFPRNLHYIQVNNKGQDSAQSEWRNLIPAPGKIASTPEDHIRMIRKNRMLQWNAMHSPGKQFIPFFFFLRMRHFIEDTTKLQGLLWWEGVTTDYVPTTSHPSHTPVTHTWEPHQARDVAHALTWASRTFPN